MFNLSKTALFVHGNESQASYLLVVKDTIYFINKNIDKKTISQLSDILGIDYNEFEFYSFIQELRERPDVIFGEYNPITKILTILSEKDETFMPSSHLLRNVVNQLGIKRIDYQGGDDQKLISSFYKDDNLGRNDFTGQLPEMMYHGTSSKYASSILRIGLNPNGISNYKKIMHYDKVFLTSQFNKASYHAINACKDNLSFPVVFEVKIPDKNLLIPDFDVEALVPDNMRTKNYESNQDFYENYNRLSQQEKDPFNLSKDYGIFGYKGRISASFITKIFIHHNTKDGMVSVSPDNWRAVNQEQLSSAIEFGGVEFYDQYRFCYECGNEKENCVCEKCPTCNKAEYECSCDQKWSMVLEKSKPLIKTANTLLINNQKRFEIEISDTDRYTSDKYEIVLALTPTIRGYNLGFQLNSAQLGVAGYVEYWYYNDDQKSLADQTFDKIKTVLLNVAKDVQFNSPPLATILPMFRYALRNIDVEHKEKSGVFIYNEYLKIQDKVQDYRKSIYGNRYKNTELNYLGENIINSDETSKQIESNEKGRKKQLRYKQASNYDFYKDAESLAMNDKFTSWINLSKNFVLPFLTWLSLTYGIHPAQAQEMATSQPVQIQQKIEEFKQQEAKKQSEQPKIQFSDKFKKCLNITLKFEGGYSNHPSDKGKATNFGITTQTYKNYLANNKINKPADVKSISREEVEKIYHDMYWTVIQGEKLPEPIAIVMFDYAVHSGPSKAIKGLQRTLSAKETGRLDNDIINKLLTSDSNKLAQNLLKERQTFLAKLVQKQKGNKVFSKGWNNRCNSIQKQISHTQPTNTKKKMPIVPNSLKIRSENTPEKWYYNFGPQIELFI